MNNTIEINRIQGSLKSVSLVVSILERELEDGCISITIPFFNLKTFAKNSEDVETAFNEAIKCFCLNSEKFGLGLEEELKSLGWSISESNEAKSELICMSFNTL